MALARMVLFRIQLPSLVLGGTGRRDQIGINARALSHGHAALSEMGLHRLKDEAFGSAVDLLAELEHLVHVPKARIVVTSGILSMIMSIPAKQRMVATSVSALFVPGTHRMHYCCI